MGSDEATTTSTAGAPEQKPNPVRGVSAEIAERLAARADARVNASLGGHKPTGDKLQRAVARFEGYRRVNRWARRILGALVILGAVYLVVRFDIFKVPDGFAGMTPTMEPGDTVMVDTLYEWWPDAAGDLWPNDIVLYTSGGADGGRYLARVIATAGQRVIVEEIPTRELRRIAADAPAGDRINPWRYRVVGAEPLPPWIAQPPLDPAAPVTEKPADPGLVPEGSLFVLHDNARAVPALDSRSIGFLPIANVESKVVIRFGGADSRLPVQVPKESN